MTATRIAKRLVLGLSSAASVLCAGATVAATSEPAEVLQLWVRIHEVLSHPRCANCHVGNDNIPRWSGKSYGPGPQPHGMNVRGGASRIGAEVGLTCGACHGHHNMDVSHGPPGAEAWLLAPVSMQWFDRSSAQICAQIKDPARNGGRTLAKMADHIEHDALVQWGWKPGPGREPAPHSAKQLAQWIRDWQRAGAPCPKS